MSFPAANAHVVASSLGYGRGNSDNNALGPAFELVSHPLFQVPAVVDVSGMELAIATQLDGLTGTGQTIASGTTTLLYKPHDGNTNAGGATGNNNFFAATDFSNSATGTSSWTVAHGAMRAVGTSTTDLDADDWVNLDVAAALTGAIGHGAIAVSVAFIYGKPAAVA
jgi:hypothetical protein